MSAKRAPPAAPASLKRAPPGYAKWIADVKQRVRAAQMRASVAVNHELVALYWSIGRDPLDRRAKSTWGDGVIDRASADLRAEFPNMEGFSRSNLKYIRQFAEAWPDVDQIRQQPVGQLPWSTNLVLLTRLKKRSERLAYAASAPPSSVAGTCVRNEQAVLGDPASP